MRDHIDLSEPCDLQPRWRWTNMETRKGMHRCHCCENDTTKDMVCVNPKHWFFGTPSENSMMRPAEKRGAGVRTHLGRKQSAEQIANRAKALRGQKRTDEQKARMSEAAKTRKPSQNGVVRGTTCWITNGMENRHQLIADPIPDGWRRGRTHTWRNQ